MASRLVGNGTWIAAAALAVTSGCSAPATYVEWPRRPPPAPEVRAVAPPDVPKALARVVVHAPFRDGNCGECHVARAGGGKLVAAASGGLCLRCHADGLRRARPHPGASACLECHARHVSVTAARLAGGTGRMCTRCHDPRATRLASVHGGEANAATCTRCHDPHGAGRGALMLRTATDRGAAGPR